MLPRLGLCLIAFLLVLVPVSHAQDVLTLESPSPAILGQFGGVLVGIQDVDDDGHADVVIGTREPVDGENSAGQAHIYSGATGLFLRTLVSPQPVASGSFSSTLAHAGDVDGDGLGDILVGATGEYEVGGDFFRDGRAYLFSGASGALLRTFASPNPQSNADFGRVAAVPDVLGDGLPDYLIGAGEEDVDGVTEAGRAYLFNSATGSVLHTLESLHPEAFGDFGTNVAGVPDLTGDGRGDLLVGAHNEAIGEFPNAGRLYVFDGASGGLVHEIESPAPSANGGFGQYIAGASDLNGDGRGDILVSQSGIVYVYNGATGTLLFSLTSPNGGSTFGRNLTAVSDTDGDGRGDLFIPAGTEDVGEVLAAGRAYLFSGATGALLETFESPNAVQNGFFGSAVASLPASRDLLVGASFEDPVVSNAGRAYLFQRATPTSTELVVNDTRDLADADDSDDVCDVDESTSDNQCTLRAAIETAKLRAGRDSVSFSISGNGPHTITLGSALPSLGQPLVIDATTQPGYAGKPVVILAGGGPDGFVLNVGQTTIRGFALGGYSGAGVRITGPGGNSVEACHIGVNATGTMASPNAVGLVIEGSPSNTIGGPLPALRNIISGNTGNGIEITGAGATGNAVVGNYIGTDASGALAMGNEAGGINIDGAPGTVIGGGEEAARNLISANGRGDGAFGSGIRIAGEDASGTMIVGNYIGTDAEGAMGLPNTTGIKIEGAPGTRIGGDSQAEGNLISGNVAFGVDVDGPGADGTTIKGNYIGVTATGDEALGNGSRGIEVMSANDVVIGGATGSQGQAPGNVISGNGEGSVLVEGSPETGSSNNLKVLGNLIGLDATGMVALTNGSLQDGIRLDGLAHNAVIGQAGAGNVVVANGADGIVLRYVGSNGPNGAQIAANTLGLNAAGGEVLGTLRFGIKLDAALPGTGIENVQIGTAGAGNQIIAQFGGILVQGAASTGASVTGNTVGLLANGTLAGEVPKEELASIGIAVFESDGVQIVNNTVGGMGIGILLGSNTNEVKDNRIGTNPAGTSARPNVTGILVPGLLQVAPSGREVDSGSDNVIGGEGDGNVISGNVVRGVMIGRTVLVNPNPGTQQVEPFMTDSERTNVAERSGAQLGTPDRNRVSFNRIGTNTAGTQEIGNGRSATFGFAGYGVQIVDGEANEVIRNTISGNGNGIEVNTVDLRTLFSGNPIGTILGSNRVGASATSDTPVPNQFIGIRISANATLVTAELDEEGGGLIPSLILGNGSAGVEVVVSESSGEAVFTRFTSLEQNGEGAITFFNCFNDCENPSLYPDNAPQPPRMLTAIAGMNQANARISPRATGPVDVFSTAACEGGLADGRYRLTVNGMADVAGTVALGYSDLGVSSSEEAVGLYLSSTSTTETEMGLTSVFSDCLRIASEENSAEVFVPGGETGPTFDGLGLDVEVTDNPPPGPSAARRVGRNQGTAARRVEGTLYIARHDLAPDHPAFEGTATSGDGSTITPNAVSGARYWTLTQDGLEGITYTACLDITGIDAIQVPEQLVLVQRAIQSRAWTPFASTLEENSTRLCAEGLMAFGDLGIGADSLVNPVPNEPGPGEGPGTPGEAVPEAFALSAAQPNPFRGQTTLRLDAPEAGRVAVTVYDLLGREVAVLTDELMAAGTHRLAFEARGLPSGVYLVRLVAQDFVATQRVTLVR